MQFSDTSNLQGIIQDITSMCDADTTDYPTNDRVRDINNEYLKVVNFVTMVNDKIQWADTFLTAPYNYADYNVTDTVANITITKPFKYHRAEVKDSNGKWHKLELIDVQDVDGAIQEHETTNGVPKQLRVDGDSVTLYPTPNYTLSNALRIYAQPEPSLFDSADTTETPVLPGFSHKLLSLGPSILHCIKYKPDRVPGYKLLYDELYDDLREYYSDRSRGGRTLKASTTNTQ